MKKGLFLFFLLPLFAGCTSSIFFFFETTSVETSIQIESFSALTCAIQATMREDWDQADMWIRKALEKDPKAVEILRQAARIQFHRKNAQEGLDFLEKASDLAGKDPMLHLDISSIYEEQGYFSHALQEYLQALKLKPQLKSAGERILEILSFLGKPVLSEYVLRELLSLLPPSSLRDKTSLELAQSLRMLGKDQEALKVLARLEKNPSFKRKVLLEKIYLSASKKKYLEGIKLCSRALKDYPQDVTFYYALGRLLEKNDQKQKATLIFKEILYLLSTSVKITPSYSLSQRLTLMGELYLRLSNEKESIRSLLKALELNPVNRQAVIYLSNTLYKRREIKLASRILEAYLRRVPYDKELKGELAYIYSKKGLFLQQAIQYATESLEVFPNNRKFLYALGWAYFQNFEFQKALSALLQADLHESSTEVSQSIGYIYFCMGDLENSQKWYLKAQKLSPKSSEIQHRLLWIEGLLRVDE